MGILARGRRWMSQLPVSSWSGVAAGFIVSTGRTGTQRLAEVIAAATEGVRALHEPSPDLFELGEAFARGAISDRDAARALRRARQPLCNRLRRERVGHLVESNTNAAYLPRVIRTIFDAPRFVHVVRDGREVVRSLYSKKGPSRRSSRPDALFMDHDDARCRFGAPDLPGDPWAGEWDRLSRFERISWHWARKNGLIREALGGRDDAITLRFEDIFDERAGFPGFWRLVEFLELGDRLVVSRSELEQLLSRKSNQGSDHLLPPPAEWTEVLSSSFDRVAGAEQRLYYPELRAASR